MIQLEKVSKSFDGGASWSVREVDLEVAAGETFMLLGTSGCGKSTTLRMINRLEDATEGTVRVGGEDVSTVCPVDLRRRIGYVIQKIGLFPHMTIEENVGVVPRLLGWDAARRRARSHELLDLVHLPPDTFAGRYPDELSGGQQQRVGVARALAADPDVLLMDEPFGALDALTRDALQQEVVALKETLGKTIVVVTHDLFEALALGDRIAVMHAGRVEQVGTPRELLKEPATDFVAELFAKPQRDLELLQAVEA